MVQPSFQTQETIPEPISAPITKKQRLVDASERSKNSMPLPCHTIPPTTTAYTEPDGAPIASPGGLVEHDDANGTWGDVYLFRLSEAAQEDEIRVCVWQQASDGYRWEIYGSTSRPSSTSTGYNPERAPLRKAYYRCLNSRAPHLCNAKKIMQQHPYDSRVMIVTYKGTHNHAPITEASPMLKKMLDHTPAQHLQAQLVRVCHQLRTNSFGESVPAPANAPAATSTPPVAPAPASPAQKRRQSEAQATPMLLTLGSNSSVEGSNPLSASSLANKPRPGPVSYARGMPALREQPLDLKRGLVDNSLPSFASLNLPANMAQ